MTPSLSSIDTAPIPEDPNSYERYDGYGQGGEAWQADENAYPDGAGYNDGYAQGDQWEDRQGPQMEVWDTGQDPQQWAPPTTSPANAPHPSGPAAYAAWGREPQDPYGAARPPHSAPQHPLAAPPPGPPPTQPPRPRPDYGAPAGAPAGTPAGAPAGVPAGTPSWQNWGAEAMAMANNRRYVQPPPQPHGTGYGNPNRVAFANHDPYASFEDQGEVTPQAQRMIYDSIAGSRGGAPKQPHQRSARGSAQNSMHTTKHSKKSKKEKRAQGQSGPNGWGGQQENPAWQEQENQQWGQENSQWGQENTQWGQENAQWGQENAQWDKEGYGYGQQGADWEKQQPAVDQWPGAGEVGRDDLDSEGYTDSEGWNDVTGRKYFRRTVSNAFVPSPAGGSPYPMSSRTMAYANETLKDPLEAFSPGLSRKRNTMHDYADMDFLESDGDALKPVENAFFGRYRKARERIHWQFPHDKDDRVRQTLEWLHDYAHGVGAFGVSILFLQLFSSFSTTLAEQVFTNTRARCFVHKCIVRRSIGSWSGSRLAHV